jgi:hypothetical protein
MRAAWKFAVAGLAVVVVTLAVTLTAVLAWPDHTSDAPSWPGMGRGPMAPGTMGAMPHGYAAMAAHMGWQGTDDTSRRQVYDFMRQMMGEGAGLMPWHMMPGVR